jgi:FkbM family methyltransferase
MINRLKNWLSGLLDLFKFDNALQLVVNRLFFRTRSLVVYRLKGMDILVDHAGGDQSGTRDCLVTDMYRRHFRHLPRGKPLNVMDLGANGGGLTLSLAVEGFTLRSLLCVEMNPSTFSRLQFNIARNIRAERTLVLNAAAFDRDGEISVQLGQGGTNDSLFAAVDGGRKMTIPARSLQSLLTEGFNEDAVDFCKIDVEGAEFQLLLAAPKDCLSRLRWLCVEIHPTPDFHRETLHAHLVSSGLELVEESDPGAPCSVCLYRSTEANH